MFDHPNAPYDSKFCNQAGTYRVDVGPKFYIGSTTRLGSRHSSHRADLTAGKHPNKALQAAWSEHQDFRFTVLTLIPAKDCDRGRDHAERLKFYEQRLLDESFNDPDCCNASESSRYNTTLSGVMKAKWRDPEFRVTATRKLRAARKANPVGPETREKMAAAKRGLAGPAARPCVLQLPGSDVELAFESVSEAAAFVGVSQQAMQGWVTGRTPWPGLGLKPPRVRRLAGLRGRYIERGEFESFVRGAPALPPPTSAVPPRSAPKIAALRRRMSYPARRLPPGEARKGEKYTEVEITIQGSPPARFTSVHAAARVAKTTHLKMYQWLVGERPWPEGLTGRAITPL
jgi:hypothetical protein